MDGTDKKLVAILARVRKHLGRGSMFGVAWGAVKEQLLHRCAMDTDGQAADLCGDVYQKQLLGKEKQKTEVQACK
jgi:hypothetical protein